MQLFNRLKLLFSLFILILGCEEDNTNNISSENIEVITSNFYETPFYYNLVTNTEDVTNWHISLQNIAVDTPAGTYFMPSVILSSNVLVSVYNEISFDDIITPPNDIEWSSDTSLTSYNKEYEVLHYPYNCLNIEHSHNTNVHQIMVMSDNYLLKEISTNNIYKLHFEEYDSWVVLFKFVQLNVED